MHIILFVVGTHVDHPTSRRPMQAVEKKKIHKHF